MTDQEISDMKCALNDAITDIMKVIDRLYTNLEYSGQYRIPLRRAVASLQESYTLMK